MCWSPGQIVRHVDDVSKRGTVTQHTRQRASGLQYGVQWNGILDYHYEDELLSDEISNEDPFDLINKGCYGRIEGLRQTLIHTHLTGNLANVIYAMGLTQTDFYPHQYKPLLTLLDSPINGLLIADEVGLGKTIEAGLIWTELRARHNMRRLLVVCPAMLREKWKDELSSRFGLNASIMNASELLDALVGNDDQDQAWIVSYQGISVPKNSTNDQNNSTLSSRERLAEFIRLSAEKEENLFDLVIFDEAHHTRNEGTNASRTGRYLRDVSKYQLMLSATPINLHSEDLRNLLRLLDPARFECTDDFHALLKANQPLVLASDIVRNPQSEGDEIHQALRQIKKSPELKNSVRVQHLIEDAQQIETWTVEHRVDIASKLERLNLLAYIVTRTRKREVQALCDRVLRDVSVFEAEMSPIEQDLYRTITQETRAYAQQHSIKHGFLVSMPQRMAVSSPTGLLQAWRGSEEETDDPDALALFTDETNEDKEDLYSKKMSLKIYLSRCLHGFSLNTLKKNDSKFCQFAKALRNFFAEDNESKALVFTTFRGTARYLVERLASDGIANARLLMGGCNKSDVIAAFRDDPTCRILVCTEVAAEGVDLQFCRLVINYDLPWNPMRIEQRIGRIDRIGQTSRRILIWNFVHKDTIDSRILARLHQRLGIFKESLGETDEILGQVRKLEDMLLSKHLSDEEEARLIDEVAIALENNKKRQEELEKEAVHLIAHGQQLLTQIETACNNGNTVNRSDLTQYVSSYLKKMEGCQLTEIQGNHGICEIRLSARFTAEFNQFLRNEKLFGKTRLNTGFVPRCRFVDKLTEKPTSGEEIIHRFHPLIRYISHSLQDSREIFSLYASKVTLPAFAFGRYVLMVKVASFSGFKSEDHLLVEGVRLEDGLPMDSQNAEALLDSIRRSGKDWPTAAQDTDAEGAVIAAERCEKALRDRYRNLADKKIRENQDRIEMQLHTLDRRTERKRERFAQIIQGHEEFAALHANTSEGKKRKALVNAERQKQENFQRTMDVRREELLTQRRAFSSENTFVCLLVVQVDKTEGSHDNVQRCVKTTDRATEKRNALPPRETDSTSGGCGRFTLENAAKY